jgi:hypothetical protein
MKRNIISLSTFVLLVMVVSCNQQHEEDKIASNKTIDSLKCHKFSVQIVDQNDTPVGGCTAQFAFINSPTPWRSFNDTTGSGVINFSSYASDKGWQVAVCPSSTTTTGPIFHTLVTQNSPLQSDQTIRIVLCKK